MYKRVLNASSKPKLKFHGIDSNKRLTKMFRESLNSSWLHPYIRIRRFIHDYSWPIWLTIAFLLIISVAAVMRVTQRASLANLLAGVTSAGQDYGTLLSTDKTDELKRNSDNEQPAVTAPEGTPTSFALNTENTARPPAAATPSSPGSVASPPAAPSFSSAIAYFRQDSVTLECTNPKPKLPTCSKRYTFGAGISTQHGPGTVRYGWRSNLQSATEDGSLAAGSGQVVTPVQKVIILACTNPTDFSLQLTLLSPTVTQSATLNVTHNCAGI